MKKVRNVCLGIFTLFGLLGVTAENWGQPIYIVAPAKTAPLTPYTNASEKVSFKFPGNWTVQEMNQRGEGYVVRMVAIRPEVAGDIFKENVSLVVTDLPDGITLSESTDADLKNLSKSLQAFKKIKIGDLQGTNMAGKFIVYTFKYPQFNLELKVVVFIFIKGKKEYALTCTSTADNYARYENLFMSIGQSFKFNF